MQSVGMLCLQMLSSEQRADSFRLALWNSPVHGTQEDLHTSGPPATLVNGSYQLLREGPLGTEVSLECVLHLLSAIRTQGKLSGSHRTMDPIIGFPSYPKVDRSSENIHKLKWYKAKKQFLFIYMEKKIECFQTSKITTLRFLIP